MLFLNDITFIVVGMKKCPFDLKLYLCGKINPRDILMDKIVCADTLSFTPIPQLPPQFILPNLGPKFFL